MKTVRNNNKKIIRTSLEFNLYFKIKRNSILRENFFFLNSSHDHACDTQLGCLKDRVSFYITTVFVWN